MRLFGSSKARLYAVGNVLDECLFGSLLRLRQANRIVQKLIDQDDPRNYLTDPRLRRNFDQLRDCLSTSIERLNSIENKARSTLLGVAVAVAVLGSATTIFGEKGPLAHQVPSARALVAIVLLGSSLFLLISGYLALRAYEVGQVYRATLDDRGPFGPTEYEASIVLFCIEQNDRVVTLRANRLSACFTCLRNGLILTALFAFLIVIVAV